MLKRKKKKSQDKLKVKMQTGIMNALSEGARHSLYSQIHTAMLSGDHNDINFVF